MKKINLSILELMTALLILLWTYAALVKLIDPALSLLQMRNQVFPSWMAEILAYGLPILEILLVLLLLVPSTRKLSFLLSTGLLTAFTIYIILVKLLLFGRVPCSCGGIISSFTWTQHLIFNLFFLTLSAIGLISTQKERRSRGRAA